MKEEDEVLSDEGRKERERGKERKSAQDWRKHEKWKRKRRR